MKWMAPRTYPEFTCIADRCRHSCCIGWEIDVDQESMALFGQLKGKMRDRLTSRIARHEDGTGHFILGEGERCPFLNRNGLCDMITEYGEDVLCQICRDHPRYYQDYGDRTEAGLGLCCEEACRLMLEYPGKMELTVLEDDGDGEEPLPEEAEFYGEREKILKILQDRSMPVESRRKKLAEAYGFENETDRKALAGFMKGLEILDEAWRVLLEGYIEIEEKKIPVETDWEVAREQFMFSLIYRHLPLSLEGEETSTVLKWILVMEELVARMSVTVRGTGLKEYEDTVRMFSSEIEYSEENGELIRGRL